MFRWVSVFSLVTVSSVIGLGYLWMTYRKRENEVPAHWKRAGVVEDLLLYPLKSGKATQLEEAFCSEEGLRETLAENKGALRDRCFVIYHSPDHEVLSVLKWKKAALISVKVVDEEVLLFQAPDSEDFKLQLSPIIATPERVKIKRNGLDYETVDCGDEVAKWLSQYLTGSDGSHRLGCYVENFVKQPDLREEMKSISSAYRHWRRNDAGLYADLTSYLIVNSKSVDDVNSKLPPEDHFTYMNLRPNIVVKGEKAYAEDDWKWIKLGDDVVIRVVKPCTRCTKITINATNAERNKRFQPLKILKSYRTVKQVKGLDVEGDSVAFGINAGLYTPGRVKIGDPVYVNV